MLLITIASGPNRGRAIRLAENTRHIIGRKNGTIALDDPKVSRKHAELIAYLDGQVILKDLSSRNGTYLDKQKVTTAMPLREGAVIQAGRSVLVFSRVAESIASMPAAPTEPSAELLEAREQTRRVIEEVREGLRRLDAAPTGSASHDKLQTAIVKRLDEVSARLASLSELAERQGAAESVAVRELSPKIEAILEAQASRPLSNTEAMAAQLADLHRKLDAMAAEAGLGAPGVSVHSRLDEVVDALNQLAESKAEDEPEWVEGLERKIEALSETHGAGAVEALAGKVQTLIGAFHALPQAQGLDPSLQAKLDAVLGAVQTASPEGLADLGAIASRLDDLLALVAAQVLPAEPLAVSAGPGQGVAMPELEARLDAILKAVIERQGVEGSHESQELLIHVAQRVDEIAARADGPLILEDVSRHWAKLEERLMQHLRGTSEAAGAHMRKAVGELTTAVRGLAERSDRAVLEQVLGELREHNPQAVAEVLEELSERMRRLPGGTGHTVEMNAMAQSVRQAFEKVGDQLDALPDKVNNNLVLGDILDLLRSIERHQRHQSQWLQSVDEKLDNLGASETAVFSPITDAPMGSDVDPESAAISTEY